ncbi:hypothetical protein [Streptomyces monomycini]|uniref:hypothetical protein n=1 Tax=Streptomyces monomycini TaxID=371720 RepID=UPI0005197EDB|nr:hypothetical protein [Streptomyces monomycini]
MSGAARPSGTTAAVVELAVWWAALTALWLVLVSSLDLLECLVGAAAALLGACAARAARRAAVGGAAADRPARTGPEEGRPR